MTDLVPNHHADHPGFSGIGGLVAAVGFLFGRDDDARIACELAGVQPGDRVVDIGCGPGTAVREAVRRGATAVGVDPAPVMLRVGRLATRGRGVDWRVGAAEELPVGDREADVVWSIATVHHWHDVARGLAEVRRVLRPGGRVVAIERRRRPGTTGHASHGWTDDQAAAFAEALGDHGCTGVEVGEHASKRGTLLSVRGELAG